MTNYSLEDTNERELYPGYYGKVIHTDNMTLVYWRAEAYALLPAHAHPHEQVVSILKGRFELSVSGGNTSILSKGDVAVIPGNTEHAGRAVTDCEFLDVCYPVRKGYATTD